MTDIPSGDAGFPAAGGPPFARLAADIVARGSPLPRGKLVLIDGRAGAGKSTLAAGLSQLLGDAGLMVATIALDDVYDGWEGLTDPSFGAHLEAWIAEPLRAGAQPSYQVYDWARGGYNGWRLVPPADVYVIEGVGAGHPALAGISTLLIWVEAPGDVRRSRAAGRRGPPASGWWAHWRDRETAHFRRYPTRGAADWVVTDGDPSPRHPC